MICDPWLFPSKKVRSVKDSYKIGSPDRLRSSILKKSPPCGGIERSETVIKGEGVYDANLGSKGSQVLSDTDAC